MPSGATNAATRREWRELGFYYELDHPSKVWRLIGSRAGLSRFVDALLRYVGDPRNALTSEHEHYGPYMYLKVMTWPEAGFDNHSIHAPLAQLESLARIIEVRLATALPGSIVSIREEFATNSPYALALEVREDGFDPASADPQLLQGNPPRIAE